METNPSKGGHARWIVNDGSDGTFDAVIVTIGTCGAPKWVEFEGMPSGFVAAKRGETQSDQGSGEDGQEHDGNHGQDSTNGEQNVPANNTFQGHIFHSSQLDSANAGDLKGKTVIVIGSGASGGEAVEAALARGAGKCIMLARDDKV